MPSSTQPTRPTAWPEGVVARYLTVAGATVDTTDNGEDTYWRYDNACTGCTHKDGFLREDAARRDAQRHAEKCRALPRPTA